jgi:hypothetical protein
MIEMRRERRVLARGIATRCSATSLIDQLPSDQAVASRLSASSSLSPAAARVNPSAALAGG